MNLLARDKTFLIGDEHSQTVLPCHSTSPDVKVTLKNEEKEVDCPIFYTLKIVMFLLKSYFYYVFALVDMTHLCILPGAVMMILENTKLGVAFDCFAECCRHVSSSNRKEMKIGKFNNNTLKMIKLFTECVITHTKRAWVTFVLSRRVLILILSPQDMLGDPRVTYSAKIGFTMTNLSLSDTMMYECGARLGNYTTWSSLFLQVRRM